jgi:predicted ATPase with chaperone activity
VAFKIVGLPDAAIQDVQEGVRAAIRKSGTLTCSVSLLP